MRKKMKVAIILCFLCVSFIAGRKGASLMASGNADADQVCIVLDAGHGSSDPGKVGVNGALEKDINLAITLQLAKILENKGYKVVLTRDSDEILADKDAVNQKREDMVGRVKVIEEAQAALTVSIHQNSFSNAPVSGPQVFYYAESQEGKEIATALQASLDEILEPESPRATKANSEYYLLKKTPTPTVIVECGFLSNEREAELLSDELYQTKVARAIYFGVCRYLESEAA
jgi:N-acetylmuramoyl-L-alanine amidase